MYAPHMDEQVMFLVYASAVMAVGYLLRRSPDLTQRVAMILFLSAFAIQAALMLVASFNGYNEELREILRALRRTGYALLQAGVFVWIGRLLWKEWVRGPLKVS